MIFDCKRKVTQVFVKLVALAPVLFLVAGPRQKVTLGLVNAIFTQPRLTELASITFQNQYSSISRFAKAENFTLKCKLVAAEDFATTVAIDP